MTIAKRCCQGLFLFATSIWASIWFLHVPQVYSERLVSNEESNPEQRGEIKATYIGHATVLVRVGGDYILTDPVFSDTISILKRHVPAGVSLSELPSLSALLISHFHYDHFDLPTLKRINAAVPIIVPSGSKRLIRSLKDRTVIELSYWDSWEAGKIKITAVPARHPGGRWLVDSFYRPANGYIIEGKGDTVFFAGDTARKNLFKEIGEKFKIDLALLPIGAYRPRWVMRMGHIGPEEALDVFSELQAGFMIPIHWGVFKLSLEPLAEPVTKLKEIITERKLEASVIVLEPGDSWSR